MKRVSLSWKMDRRLSELSCKPLRRAVVCAVLPAA